MSRDLGDYLVGRWDVERSLSEGGEEGTFTGVAEFSPAGPGVGGAGGAGSAGAGGTQAAGGSAGAGGHGGARDRLVWDEHGRMRWRGNDLEARRRLELVREVEGWNVYFDDGRPFHPLDLSTGSCAAVHPCGEDHYEGEYRVLDEDLFEVVWRVRGPRKDQLIHTRYRRL